VTAAESSPAVRCDDVVVKPANERLIGDRVCFVDGSKERIDQIVLCDRLPDQPSRKGAIPCPSRAIRRRALEVTMLSPA